MIGKRREKGLSLLETGTEVCVCERKRDRESSDKVSRLS